MLDWVRSLPLIPAIGFLYIVILLRAGATYALARGAHRLAHRGRIGAWLEGPRVSGAIALVNRWGAPVVALSFLTVGFQTAANAAAGLTRMPLVRYLPALALGGLAWAVVYATVGLATIALWVELFLRSPWAAVAVLAVVAAVVIMVIRERRAGRSRRRNDDPAARTR